MNGEASFSTIESTSNRPRPLHPGPCPFCGIALNPQTDIEVNRFHFQGEEYVLVRNNNPIAQNQLILFPRPRPHPPGFLDHRIDLNGKDVELMAHLSTNKLCDFDCPKVGGQPSLVSALSGPGDDHLAAQPWATYVNASPSSGRSVTHLHISCLVARSVPVLRVEPVPWQVCEDSNGTIISRLSSDGFYAIVVEASSSVLAGQTIEKLHKAMDQWEIPYNPRVNPLSVNAESPKAIFRY